MYLHDISNGARFSVAFDDGRKFVGEYDGRIDHMNFHMYCQDMLKDADALAETVVTIECGIKDAHCSFTAEILGKSERPAWARETFDMRIKTPIKVIPRRETFRVEIKMKVKIHAYKDNKEDFFTGEQLCEAITEDVSRGGVRVWSDLTLDVPQGALFVLEFSSPLRATYLVPARLMRNLQNTATRAYNYDFGFAFDFSANPEQQDVFIMDVVEAKLRGEGRLTN